MISSDSVEFRAAMQGFTLAVSESVETVQNKMLDKPSGDRNKDVTELTEAMRGRYQARVKQLFARDADACLPREFGIIFGSLVTHLQAIYQQWLVYNDSNNSLVQKPELNTECALAAVRQGLRHTEMASDIVAKLVRLEAARHSKASMLAALLTRHCRATNVTYRHPFGDPSYAGYAPDGVGVGFQKRNSIGMHFYHHDGIEPVHSGIGELFNTPPLRATLQSIAEQAFGEPVQFSADYNTIKFKDPVFLA